MDSPDERIENFGHYQLLVPKSNYETHQLITKYKGFLSLLCALPLLFFIGTLFLASSGAEADLGGSLIFRIYLPASFFIYLISALIHQLSKANLRRKIRFIPPVQE